MYLPLSQKFFARSSTKVAKDLIGKVIVRQLSETERLVAKIVETESYGHDDPACHGFRNCERQRSGKDIVGRSALLFGPPGFAYVYLNYGMYWLFNVVTEKKGVCGAVLIRAVEPLEGLDFMQQRRPQVRKISDLTNGPGKLTLSLGIDRDLNGQLLTQPPLYFAKISPPQIEADIKIKVSPRIGITKGQDRLWRFYDARSAFVSRIN